MVQKTQPLATSYASPTNYQQRKDVYLPPEMPGVIIFVHGVNSDGEWYENAETHLLAGLNKRLGREDLCARSWDKFGAKPNPLSSETSPIIHFFWGYRAKDGEEKKWKVPLRNKNRKSAWSKNNEPAPPLHWGGGAFQNGCNNLPLLWSDEGFKRRIWAAFIPIDVQGMNPEVDRQLQDAPPRNYYAHAAGRLADLVRKVRGKYEADTITLIGHSQGTQIVLAALALLEANNQPDAVMLMNGPYALESKVTDSLAQGNRAPTEKARKKTFENIVQRFQSGHRALTDNLLAKLRVGVTSEGKLWTPKAPGERDNTGRLYIYFNPHDRVMGSTALQSIGWQGVPDSLLNQFKGTLYQRMLARTTPCGAEPGKAYLWPRDLDRSLKPFWNKMKKTKGLIRTDLWTTPDKDQQVTINAALKRCRSPSKPKSWWVSTSHPKVSQNGKIRMTTLSSGIFMIARSGRRLPQPLPGNRRVVAWKHRTNWSSVSGHMCRNRRIIARCRNVRNFSAAWLPMTSRLASVKAIRTSLSGRN